MRNLAGSILKNAGGETHPLARIAETHKRFIGIRTVKLSSAHIVKSSFR